MSQIIDPPAFAILIKAFNEEAVIGDAIRSALAQTRKDFELIVIDDGSADGTARVVGGFSDPRIRLVTHEENRGVSAALNTGVASASAPLVSLLDADDLWMPDYLEVMGATLAATPGAGFAYTDAWWLDQEGGRFFKESTSEYLGAPRDPPTEPSDLLRSLLGGNWLFGLTTMRRAAVEDVGGFNESLLGCEDYEMWVRLLAAGYPGVRAPGRLALQRDRRGSMSKDVSGMLRRRLLARRIWLERPPAEVTAAFPWLLERRADLRPAGRPDAG